jgi:hypothetical protein
MALIFSAFLSMFSPQAQKPLPDLNSFLAEFRKTLHTDTVALSQYSYTEKQTSIEMGPRGNPVRTEVKVYEVTPGPQGTFRRRLVSVNGAPASDEPQRGNRQLKSNADRQGSDQANAEQDEEVINEAFALYDIRIDGREIIDGRPAIRLTFRPRPGFRPKTTQGEFMQHVAGQAWVDEADHQLVRIDAEAIDTFSLGNDLTARLQKGATITAERRKFDNTAWLPIKTEMALSARVLLVKNVNMRQITEYSNHKRVANPRN